MYMLQMPKVHVKRSVRGRDTALSGDNGNSSHTVKSLKPPVVRKGKLVVVDLAGSERIDKSGMLHRMQDVVMNSVYPTFFCFSMLSHDFFLLV